MRWLWLALVVAMSCNAFDPFGDPKATDLTGTGRVYLIGPDDGGAHVLKTGCGDSAVPVEVGLTREQPALAGSLEALIALRKDYDSRTGLYNALHASRLELDRVVRSGAEVKVYLTGYLAIERECDGPRVLAQLRETALQFPDVQRAGLFLEGRPLEPLLLGRGE